VKSPNKSPRGSSNWKQKIQQLLGSKDYRPESKSGLARMLSVPTEERSELREVLRELQDEGKIESIRRGRYVLASKTDKSSKDSAKADKSSKTPTKNSPKASSKNSREPAGAASDAQGILRFRYNGTAFVVLEKPATTARGIRIPAKVSVHLDRGTTGVALPYDRVSLALEATKVPSSWRNDPSGDHRVIDLRSADELKVEGRVTGIIQREEHRIIGSLLKKKGALTVKPDSSTYPNPLHLPTTKDTQGLKHLERVLVEIADWSDPNKPPVARLLDRLGMPGDEGLGMREIVFANDIREHFPSAVIDEAKAIPQTIPHEMIVGREDWRKELVFTIDPEDARDFDDAISIIRLDDGWELAVHIADVSAYVEPGSAMDIEARKRGNSTYLPSRVIPMLPEELSNGICSLRPNEDRLTRCVVMEFDNKGKRRKTTFVSAIIHSARRYTYEEALEYLNGKQVEEGDEPAAAILEAWKLASILRKNRFKNGGLDMEFPEVRVKLDESGTPIDLVVSHGDQSHQLIEECMLIANEAVAEELKNRGRPCLYRVHEDPAEERLLEYRETAIAHGFKVGDLTNRAEAQKLLNAANGHPAEHAIKIGFLRSLKRADYRTDPHGHYGLAKNNYTHFTSPIRRYADLIVHRTLFSKKGDPRMSESELEQTASHISKTERESASAEQDAQRLKQFEFFAAIQEKTPDRAFPAKVVECNGMGVFVEIDDWQTKGLIRSRDLPGNAYFERGAMCYRGLPRGASLKVGDPIEVCFDNVDLSSRRVDFRMAGVPRSGGSGSRGRGSRGQRGRRGTRGGRDSRGSRGRGRGGDGSTSSSTRGSRSSGRTNKAESQTEDERSEGWVPTERAPRGRRGRSTRGRSSAGRGRKSPPSSKGESSKALGEGWVPGAGDGPAKLPRGKRRRKR